MDKKIILKDFEPFYGMYEMNPSFGYLFAECRYSSVLNIVHYYGKEVLPILANPIFIYEFNEETGAFVTDIKDIQVLEAVLNDMGIIINKKSPDKDNLKNEIIDSISKGCPVIMMMDLFYQPGRPDWYRERHGPGHNLLVYGYDFKEDILHIVDDIKGLNKFILSYNEVYDCYEYMTSSGEYIAGESDAITEYALKSSVGQSLSKQDDLIQRYITYYANVMWSNKSSILKTLARLQIFADAYKQIEKTDKFIESLNSTVYKRKSERYRLLYLCRYNFDALNIASKMDILSEEVINCWEKIRSMSVKAFYANMFSDRMVNRVKELLHEVYEKENVYYELLFSLIERWGRG